MYGHTFYTTMDNHINNVQYPCTIPALWLSQHNAFENDLEPFFIPEVGEIVRSSITIAQMIDIVDKGMLYSFLHQDDVVEVFCIVRSYGEKLRAYNDIPEAAEYQVKVDKFLSIYERTIRALTKDRPELTAVLKENSLENILKEFSSSYTL